MKFFEKIRSFTLLALILLIFTVIAFTRFNDFNQIQHRSKIAVIQSNEVFYQSEKILTLLNRFEYGLQGYLLTGDTAFLQICNKAKDSLPSAVAILSASSASDKIQQKKVATLALLVAKQIELSDQLLKTNNATASANAYLQIVLRNRSSVLNDSKSIISNIQQQEKLHSFDYIVSNENAINSMATWFRVIIAGLIALFGSVVAFVLFDTRRRKKQVAALNQSNQQLQFANRRVDDIIGGISDPFFVLDRNFNFILFSNVGQLSPVNRTVLFPGADVFAVFPQYKDTLVNIKMKAVITDGQTKRFEYYDVLLKKWQDITIYPTAEGISVYIRDISRSKAEHRELLTNRQLMEQTNLVALVGGWELDLLAGTVTWTTVTGLIHETEPGYIPDFTTGIAFYKEGYSRDTITQAVNEAIETGKSWDVELQIVTAKGNEKWIRTRGMTEFNGNQCIRIFGTFQDIDADRRMIDKLQQSEQLFRSAFESPLMGMAMVDTNRKNISVNQAICDITGYTNEELLQTSFQQITCPDDQAQDLETFHKLIKDPSIGCQCEKRFIHKKGFLVWVLVRGAAVVGADGQIVCFVMQVQDITQKKQADVKFATERKLLKTVIDNLPLNVYMKDLQSRKTLVNKGELDFSGYADESALIGKTDFELYPQDIAAASVYEDNQVISSRQPILNKEVKSVKNGDTDTWFLISKIPYINEFDEVTGIIGISFDITELKQTQLALIASRFNLRTLFDLSPVAFVLNDLTTGKYIDFNHALVKTLGYNKEELNGLSYADITPPESVLLDIEMLCKLMDDGYCGPFEKEYFKKDGSRVPVLINTVKFLDEHNQPMGWSVIQDISLIKEKEIQLKELNITIEQTNLQLEAKNGELEQFAFIASHDMQEPLRMITSFIGLLEKKYADSLDSKGKEYLHYVVDGALRMRQIITDILDYSRTGKEEIEKSNIDLNLLIREIVNMNHWEAVGNNARIEWNGLPVIYADQTSMLHLFGNLIGNGLKYQATGNPAIIKIVAEDLGKKWQFAISDNGIGIKPENFEKVFEIFKRLHNKKDYSGTGIGLAICKKIVSNYNGKIWIESQPGQGSTFFFTIPKS